MGASFMGRFLEEIGGWQSQHSQRAGKGSQFNFAGARSFPRKRRSRFKTGFVNCGYPCYDRATPRLLGRATTSVRSLRLRFILPVCVLMVAAGCGGPAKQYQTAKVSGTVTIDKVPVEK